MGLTAIILHEPYAGSLTPVLRILTAMAVQLLLNTGENCRIQTGGHLRKDADEFLKLIDETIGLTFTSASVADWTTTVTTTTTTTVTVINNSTVRQL